MSRRSKLKIQTKGKSYCIIDSSFYKLKNKKRLSKLLNCDLTKLKLLSLDSGNYSEFDDVTAGKVRKIQCPTKDLDLVHTRIASLLSRIEAPAYLHSGKKGFSNVTNASAHVHSTSLMATDVKSFFPSTTRSMVFSFFLTVMKCSADIADLLADLCTVHNHVPTGSRISMPLAFWANCRMFQELERISLEHDVTMTVYVDDLTFSGDKVNRRFKSLVKKVISKHGHTMHPTKTMLYQKEQPKLVTGVIVHNSKLKVRNEQHQLLSSELAQWLVIKDFEFASEANVTSKLIGRLHSMGVIESRFKSKARTLRQSTQK